MLGKRNQGTHKGVKFHSSPTITSPGKGAGLSFARGPTCEDLNHLNAKLREVQLSAEESKGPRLVAHNGYVSHNMQAPVCQLTQRTQISHQLPLRQPKAMANQKELSRRLPRSIPQTHLSPRFFSLLSVVRTSSRTQQ